MSDFEVHLSLGGDTRQDGAKTEFKALPCKPSWDTAHYLLFSALGTTKTAFFIDNVKLE